MSLPPFQMPDGSEWAEPAPPQPPYYRETPMPWVWLVAAGVIGLICFGSLVQIAKPTGVEGDQRLIHRLLVQAETGAGLEIGDPKPADLTALAARLQALELTDPAAKGTLARALLVLHQKVDPAAKPDFAGLVDRKGDSLDALTPDAESNEDIAEVNEALEKAYGSTKLSAQEANEIADTLADYGARWPLNFAVERAQRLAGGTEKRPNEVLLGGLMLLILLLGLASLIWLCMKPLHLGIPATGNQATGDNLGARFLLFMVGFAVLGGLIASAFSSQMYGLLAAEIVLIGVTAGLVALPIKQRSFTLKDIGIRFDQLGQDVLYGLAGYLANFPPALLLILFGMKFMDWIPSGGHPIQSDILSAANLPILIATAGPLTAILEEIAFRGFLFQGLALRFRVWPAILLSSIGFALIHPQGGALWLSLAWIGGMAAYLTYRRQSLIPAIVMHACHNTTLILLGFLATGT